MRLTRPLTVKNLKLKLLTYTGIHTTTVLKHIFIFLSKRDPEALDGHVRPVSAIAWNPDGEQ